MHGDMAARYADRRAEGVAVVVEVLQRNEDQGPAASAASPEACMPAW